MTEKFQKMGLQCVSTETGKPVPMPEQTVLCLGNFDGVHRGHQALLKRAEELCKTSFPGATCGVFCFRELSSDYLFERSPEHLTTFSEKLNLFARYGAKIAVIGDFQTLRTLTPEAFAKEVLLQACGCRAVVCGFNYRFGKGAVGTAKTLEAMLDRPVFVCDPVEENGEAVSSTKIRTAVKEGRIRDVEVMLGRPYEISGTVEHGKELGRKLGFPTANLGFPEHSVIPKFGVYATECEIGGKRYRGVSNVGMRPTVEPSAKRANCETYLIGYDGDLYGQSLRIRFLELIRPEKKFASVDELREQIRNDAETAKTFGE